MSDTMTEQNTDSFAPEASADSGKSSRRWWMFGGCGCLLIIVLCGGGIAAVAVPLISFGQALNSAQAMASESQAAKDAFGEPLSFGAPAQQSQTDPSNLVFEVPVKGSTASGKLIITLNWASYSKFELSGLELETEDGEKIDILNSDELNITIEDPDE